MRLTASAAMDDADFFITIPSQVTFEFVPACPIWRGFAPGKLESTACFLWPRMRTDLRETGAHMTAGQNLPEWKDYLAQLLPVGDAVMKRVPKPNDPQARQETWMTL